MIESFLMLGRDVGADLIAEGIEEVAELEVLRAMGVTLFQGYLLGKPRPANDFAEALDISKSAFHDWDGYLIGNYAGESDIALNS